MLGRGDMPIYRCQPDGETMSRWTLETINWNAFDPARVTADLLAVVKTAALVEANAADYVTYLRNVFGDDAEFVRVAEEWGVEEEQHGAALGRWAELADPSWSFARALEDFRAGYKLDLNTQNSIRGSRAAELIARQIVETGTSSFYSAIRDAADEPCLKEIAHRVAQDEFFHYQLFAKYFARYQVQHPMSLWAKLKVAATRFNEAEDDELGYAYFAANVLSRNRHANYAGENYGKEYWKRAMLLYRRPHIDGAVRMMLRAVNLSPNGRVAKLLSGAFWRLAQYRTAQLAKAA
jgi:hypothetical protein